MVEEAVEIRIYRMSSGRMPFSDWLASLRDKRTVAILRARLNRIRLGNLGDVRPVGEGVQELRINWGPGYRVYFGRESQTVAVLLCGGSKKTQRRDIALAKEYWRDYVHGED